MQGNEEEAVLMEAGSAPTAILYLKEHTSEFSVLFS